MQETIMICAKPDQVAVHLLVCGVVGSGVPILVCMCDSGGRRAKHAAPPGVHVWWGRCANHVAAPGVHVWWTSNHAL